MSVSTVDMRERFITFVLFVCVVAPGILARSADDIIHSLENAAPYRASMDFEVLLPSSPEPVRYAVGLVADTAATDTLSPCRYFISWRAVGSPRPSEGFSAYFPGHHYRLRDQRMQEYHLSESPEAFAPGGNAAMGVQRQAQFASFLPQAIALTLRDIENDSAASFTVASRPSGITVEGERRRRGWTAEQFAFTFSPSTLLPLRVERTYNPGSPAEQTVTAVYHAPSPDVAASAPANEEELAALCPDAFSRWRSSTFRAASLPGSPLPAFNSRVAGTESRYVHAKGSPLEAVTIFAFLDPAVDSTPRTVEQIRLAAALAPVRTEVVWVFPTVNRADDIAPLVLPLSESETALTGARQAASACGVTLYPAVVIAGKDGLVKDVVVGANPELDTVVLQKITLIR